MKFFHTGGAGDGFWGCEWNHLPRLLKKKTNIKWRILCVIIGPAGQRNQEKPLWKNFKALASARPDCLVSSSGADYETWSGTGQNCNVFVRSAASQRLASHKPAASQPLIPAN